MGKMAVGNIGIEGIYEWGKGWTQDKASIWKDFWTSKVDIHKSFGWLVQYSECSWGRDFYLVGLSGSVFLHPMQTSLYLHSSNSADTEKFESSIRGITDLFDELAVIYKDKLGIDFKYAIEWKVYREEYLNPVEFKYESEHRVEN